MRPLVKILRPLVTVTTTSVCRILVRGSMPPCRLRRRKFYHPYPHPPFRKLLFSACFRFLIFHPFFHGGGVSWPHLPLCADAHGYNCFWRRLLARNMGRGFVGLAAERLVATPVLITWRIGTSCASLEDRWLAAALNLADFFAAVVPGHGAEDFR